MLSTQIIEGFKQGKRGNCVSIATIKAAMLKYGIDGVFTSIEPFNFGDFKIVMKDGFHTILRQHEIEKAKRFSKFNKGKNEAILNRAHFYFAAMAKRVYVEGAIDVFLGRQTLRGALRSLNNGENYLEGIKWFGLLKNFERIELPEISQHQIIIGASPKHCFVVFDSELVDNYGKVTKLSELKLSSAFELKHLIVLK